MLLIEAPFAPALASLGLQSCEDVVAFCTKAFAPPAEAVWVRSMVLPAPASLPVFYKQYEFTRPSWRFWGRRSKARCEHDNYGVFLALGIACAQRIACGEQRDAMGRLRRAFILTQAVTEARTLVEFLQQAVRGRGRAAAREERLLLAGQLAAMVRRIHDAGFYHQDLVWRNILVTASAAGEAKLWWIDCPRGGFARLPWFRRRRRMKDLASLDKSAAKFCTRGERVHFMKRYLGKPRLDAEAKQLIRDTLRYRQHRWPDDWE